MLILLRKSGILFLLCCTLIITACHQNQLVKSGGTDYIIRLDQSENEQTVRAAQLLQDYVKEMTGIHLPIDPEARISGRKTLRLGINENLSPDAYSLFPTPNGYHIQGGNHKGTIYGVIYLLEQEWGCRVYSPDFQIIPKHTQLILPEDSIGDQPINTYRIVNGRFCLDQNYQDWQSLDLIQDQFAEKFYVHTFNRLIPWEQHFDKHPEYYSEVDGRRLKDQLCLSHPEVLKITIERLKEEMAQQPEKILWSVSQNDNFTYCQCDDCMKIISAEASPAGPVIHFVNAIAREFPDKIISTLAYQYSRKAPKLVKPENNVQVMLCTIELNRSKAIADDQSSQSFLTDLKDWGQIAQHIYLWDYTVNFSHHISPFPNYHVLQPNIQLFTENQVFEHFQQSNTDTGHEFSELKSYLIAHLLWNPYINIDSLKNDFFEGYYGEAAPLVQAYFDALQQDITRTQEWLDIYGHPTSHENSLLAEDKISTYLRQFDQAKDLVAHDSARLIHVSTAALAIQYAAMEIGKNHMFEQRGWYETQGNDFKARPLLINVLEEFIHACREAGVNSVNEAGLKPEDYYEATKRFIDVQVRGNLAFRKAVSAEPCPAQKYSGGNLEYLTNGVQGASDYKVHWLGWEAQNVELLLDLGGMIPTREVTISSLYDPKSWIFHPKSVTCYYSTDGVLFSKLGQHEVIGQQKTEQVTRDYHFFLPDAPLRYIKFAIQATLQNPSWHPSAGGKSWVFVDEIVVH